MGLGLVVSKLIVRILNFTVTYFGTRHELKTRKRKQTKQKKGFKLPLPPPPPPGDRCFLRLKLVFIRGSKHSLTSIKDAKKSRDGNTSRDTNYNHKWKCEKEKKSKKRKLGKEKKREME